MKILLRLLFAITVTLVPTAGYAQFGLGSGLGEAPSGPRFGGAINKLFGEHTAFTANLEMRVREPGNPESMIIPGKMAFLEGKSRFEMDITKTKGTKIPPEAAAQVKAMGMGEITMISRPDKKVAYLVYPGMEAYMENELADEESVDPKAKYVVESTELGKETVDGRECTKSRVYVTDEKGNRQDAVVWNAHDLKGFPIRIHYQEGGRDALMTFREVKFAEPDSGVFAPPTTFKRYDSVTDLLKGIMLKQFGFGGAQ